MAKTYYDDDADLEELKDRRVGVIGYGNQGRAQSLNMRDSGVPVMVGNIEDDYKRQALEDGFDVHPLAEVTHTADVLLILIPDEVQPDVYEQDIRPGLQPGRVLCFASGYNVHYRRIIAPDGVDTIMVAPRMIGKAVRSLYQRGQGYPCLLGVEHDASGSALDFALAIAKAIGATRLGASMSSFREETVVDLFAEQMLWAGINKLAMLYFEKLVGAGCDPDVVATELHLSGEFVEIARAMITDGFFRQLGLHSHTSQYGQLTRGDRMAPQVLEEAIDTIMGEIQSGAFADEWAAEQERGLPTLARCWDEVEMHPLSKAEERLSWLCEAMRQQLG